MNEDYLLRKDDDDNEVSSQCLIKEQSFQAGQSTQGSIHILQDTNYLALVNQLEVQSREIFYLKRQLATSEAQYTAIIRSSIYQYLQWFYRLRFLLAPRGSLRDHLCRKFLRLLRWMKDAITGDRHLHFSVDPPGTKDSGRLDDGCSSILGLASNKADTADDGLINLIILSAVHRSGSTLLQRICNARKGTLIWGEHDGIITQFAQIYVKTAYFSTTAHVERIEYFRHKEDPNLWIGNMCPDLKYLQLAVVHSTRAFLNALYGQYRESHDIIGFKEVRYGSQELELLRQCYPKAEILLLVRHPCNTWRSTTRDWYPSLDAWIDIWNDRVRSHLQFAKTDAHCHMIRYEDVVAKESKTMEILTDVAKVSGAQIDNVLAHKLGSKNFGIEDYQQQLILQRCREPMQALGYI